jgi:Bax protein
MYVVKSLIKRTALILCFAAWMLPARAQNSNYIFNHKALASLLSMLYGIPTPVILSVAAVESAGGMGQTAKVLNNHFGIVGKNDLVNKYGHKSRYKQYDNVFESYLDFCNLITRKSFYGRLKNKDNVTAWIKAISHAGYSEQPEEWEKNIFKVLASNKK